MARRSVAAALVLSFGLAAAAAAQAPQPIRLTGVANPPRLVTRVPPAVPEQARAEGVSGVVGLEVVVGVDGSVTSATVTRSVPLLDQAAIDAVLQWKYEPTLLNGVAVPVAFGVSMPIPTPVRVGGPVRIPTKIVNVAPIYPPEVQAAGIEGIVILELLIGADGKVADARILKSVPGLDEPAEAAVRQWEFLPTLLDGQPTTLLYNVTVTFRRT